MNHDTINWIELTINILLSVIISSVISFLIAYYFRMKVKPKIEEIYEYNREYRIRNIASILELSDWNMLDLFKILEQNNCIGDDFLYVNLSNDASRQVTYNLSNLKTAYDDIYNKITEAKQYVSGEELLLFLDFINYSVAFADELNRGNYNPSYLRRRAKLAKLLVSQFREFFTENFCKKWDEIEESRLE